MQRPVPAIACEDMGASISLRKTTLPNGSVEQETARLGISDLIKTLRIALREQALAGALICGGSMQRTLMRQLMKF
ncbi:hypothetical protein GCM10010833_22590 [Blastomonas aquatica]|uniref:Uncharacterized protein n=1 Tax=Blastomonas aquatica TaxID=1510276 RepID=A0ABQ1JEL2_9SPHN|nr:hypothetical protein GCM10010833_22590 [Blastomonas aquatica]